VAIRVVVADDDPDVLDAECEALEADERFEVVARVCDGPAAVEAVTAHRPDAVLLDVRMPGGGIEAARAIQAGAVPVTITVASARADATLVADLLQAGVRGVFVKGHLGGDLAEMIARCCAGQVLLITPSGAEGLRIFAVATR